MSGVGGCPGATLVYQASELTRLVRLETSSQFPEVPDATGESTFFVSTSSKSVLMDGITFEESSLGDCCFVSGQSLINAKGDKSPKASSGREQDLWEPNELSLPNPGRRRLDSWARFGAQSMAPP